ncbi:ATP-binding protein, partial [Staphylococcus sp. SIMBA_130]
IYSESNQLTQVFINLLKNAMEAIGEEGEIIIKALEQKEHIQIQVIDDGSGIANEELEKLGSPFFTTKKNGTGLGLTICKRIVKKHKGTF